MIAALCAAAAGAVHVVVAYSHGLSTLLGAGLAVTAALQLAGAGLLGWRPRPVVWVAMLAVDAGAAVVAVVAHTTGLPVPGLRSPSAFDASLTVVLCLETAVVVMAAVVLAERAGRWLLPAVAAVVLLAAVPAAVGAHDHADPAGAGHDHGVAAGGPGHQAAHGGPGRDAASGGSGRDAAAGGPGHRTAAGTPDHDARDAARLRFAAFTAGLTGRQTQEILDDHGRWLTDHLLRAGRAGLTREAAAAFSDRALRRYLTAADGNGGHGHAGPAPWQPVGDLATRDRLAGQLRSAREAALQLPTAARARAAGYVMVVPYLPGIGAHYLHTGRLLDGVFDPARPEMLLYSGNGDDARVVGVSYLAVGDERHPPEGFAGPNDLFHFHPDLCMVAGMAIPAPDRASCESVGGVVGAGPAGRALWMNHAWVVPGWESPWGLFSGENPELTLAVGRPAAR
jgi:hypothetical protein